VFRKSKVGHGSKSCGNNTCRCSDRGVALARGGGGRSARLIWPTDTSTAWNGTCSGQGRRGAGRGILCGVHYAHRAPGNSSGNFHGRSQKSWAMFHRRYQNSFQGHQLFVLPKQCRCEPKLMSKPNCHLPNEFNPSPDGECTVQGTLLEFCTKSTCCHILCIIPIFPWFV